MTLLVLLGAAFAGKEGVEVEPRREAAPLTVDQRLTQCGEPHFALLEQPQRRADDIVSGPIAARRHLSVDEGAVMLVKAEGCIPIHRHDRTNFLYCIGRGAAGAKPESD